MAYILDASTVYILEATVFGINGVTMVLDIIGVGMVGPTMFGNLEATMLYSLSATTIYILGYHYGLHYLGLYGFFQGWVTMFYYYCSHYGLYS